MSSFYGDFSRDEPPAQWADIINILEVLGNPSSDVLYLVDDFKSIYIDERIYQVSYRFILAGWGVDT